MNPTRPPPTRDQLLGLAEADLLSHCRVERCRGRGPGGQHRNRTDSAVTVTHTASGLSAGCDEHRSQHANLRLAVRRLRLTLALHWRLPGARPPETPAPPGPRDERYPCWVAAVFDVLAHCGGRVSDAAALCGLSTGRLVRALARDPALWQEANRLRHHHGLPPLRVE